MHSIPRELDLSSKFFDILKSEKLSLINIMSHSLVIYGYSDVNKKKRTSDNQNDTR